MLYILNNMYYIKILNVIVLNLINNTTKKSSLTNNLTN